MLFSKVYTLLKNGNQIFEQAVLFKKETKMFWKKIWEKGASDNNKPMRIAELKSDYQALVIQQQCVKIAE